MYYAIYYAILCYAIPPLKRAQVRDHVVPYMGILLQFHRL